MRINYIKIALHTAVTINSKSNSTEHFKIIKSLLKSLDFLLKRLAT